MRKRRRKERMERKNERKNKLEDYLGMLSLSKGNIYDLVFVVLVACTLLKLRLHGTTQHSTVLFPISVSAL